MSGTLLPFADGTGQQGLWPAGSRSGQGDAGENGDDSENDDFQADPAT